MTLFHKKKWDLAVILMAVSFLLLSLPFIFQPTDGAASAAPSPWLNFLGAFHPLFLHLPIGFLVLILSLEIFSLFNKKMVQMELPLILNALVTVIASILGFIWYQTGQWPGEEMESHLWQGLIFSVSAIWLPWVYMLFKDRIRIPYYVTLLGSVGIMFSAAHLGGESVHGDPFDKAPWKVEETPLISSDPMIYEEIIVPILSRKCYSCHSDEKQKGSLRLDTVALMLDGGENDTALVKGQALKSPLITSIHAPLEEKGVHMPPKGKPQITEDELALLEWWVNAGAPEDTPLSSVNVPSEILAIIGQASSEEEEIRETAESIEQKNENLSSQEHEIVPPSRHPLAEPLRKYLIQFSNSIAWTDQQKTTLRFSAASRLSTYEDRHLNALKPFVSEFVELDFNGTSVTDEVVEIVQSCPKLHTLKLGGTKITDDGIKDIAKHPNLTKLVLHSTQVSDEGIAALSQLKSLEKLYLWGSRVSDEAAAKLAAKLPLCNVEMGTNKAGHQVRGHLKTK